MRVPLPPRCHLDDQQRSVFRGGHIEGRFLSHSVSVESDNGRHHFVLNSNPSSFNPGGKKDSNTGEGRGHIFIAADEGREKDARASWRGAAVSALANSGDVIPLVARIGRSVGRLILHCYQKTDCSYSAM
jgi:hypothetical protein